MHAFRVALAMDRMMSDFIGNPSLEDRLRGLAILAMFEEWTIPSQVRLAMPVLMFPDRVAYLYARPDRRALEIEFDLNDFLFSILISVECDEALKPALRALCAEGIRRAGGHQGAELAIQLSFTDDGSEWQELQQLI